MGEAYRVAVIGCHRMLERRLANHNWAAAFAGVPSTRLVAVCDRDAATRRAFLDCWGSMPVYDDPARLLAEVTPDIVCIATRQTQHAEQVELAATAGVRGILCDKPLATSMAEVRRIIAACRGHGVRFAFGLDRRWFPYYRTLVELIQGGAIGRVQTVAAFGLNHLLFHGCHWFDRVLEFAGDPESAWLSGQVEATDCEPPCAPLALDPPGRCHLQFANGVEALVSPAGYRRGFDMGFDIVGSRGRLVVVSEGTDTRVWSLGPDGRTPEPRPLPDIPATAPWPLLVEDLVAAIAEGRPTRCDLDCARRATELCFAVAQSSREGGRRLTPAEIDPRLRLPSLPWGNE